MTRRDFRAEMKVDLPEGSHGDVSVEHFEVTNNLENMRLWTHGRECTPGMYTRLMRGKTLWMSDTDAERSDHLEPAWRINEEATRRVLIGGLGLGMILRVALLTPQVEHVDVVELDEDVIALIGPSYEKMAEELGKSLTIHHADVFKIKWPAGTRWDVAWFDVWPDLCADNLESMSKLRRSYGGRTSWNECWGRELTIAERRRGRWSW